MTPAPKKLGYGDVQAAARDAAMAALRTGGGPIGAARAAIATADSLLKVAAAQVGLEAEMAKIQCGAGCTHCCHQMVGVSVAELALLREAVAALPEPARTATKARIAALAAKGRGLTQAQWWQARLRCALLDEQGRCLVHAARPLPCRAMNSSNADVCRQSFGGQTVDIPILAAPYKIYGHAQAGLLQALAAAGLPGRMTGLGTAL